MMGW